MAKVVDAQGREACTSGKAAELRVSASGRTGVPFSRQNTNPVVLVAGVPRQALLELRLAVCAKRGDSRRIEADRAT